MPNIKLTLQYDGTRYLGWTRPAADGYAKTISYRISSVLQKMTGEDITLFAGAKTAPGVHALCQTVNFHTESPFSDTYFLSKLNEYLPKDIHILSSEIVSDRFRSDLNAVSRTYLYRICTAPVQNIFTRAYTANIPEIISESEVAAIRKAADSLVGVHDFRSLSGVKKKKGTVKEIFDISVSHSKETENDSFSLLTIKICANDFLYLMPEHIIEFLIKREWIKKYAAIRQDFSSTPLPIPIHVPFPLPGPSRFKKASQLYELRMPQAMRSHIGR